MTITSSIQTEVYELEPLAPVISPAGGEFESSQEVTITCGTAGATIRYTTDGTEPDGDSTAYSVPITVTEATTIKAKAFKTGWTTSKMVGEVYANGIATPVFIPDGGLTSSVTITCTTAGVTIRYTEDGTEPTGSSTIYSAPITITSAITLKAKAFKSGWGSATREGIYTPDVQWTSYLDNTYWDPTKYYADWNAENQSWDSVADGIRQRIYLYVLGDWNIGFRPSQIRLTVTINKTKYITILDTTAPPEYIYQGTLSGLTKTISLNFTGHEDIGSFSLYQFTTPFSITNIEFYA